MEILSLVTCPDVAKNIIAMRDELIKVDMEEIEDLYFDEFINRTNLENAEYNYFYDIEMKTNGVLPNYLVKNY